MPSTGQKGARSRLADVLADIKNSRGDDDVGGTRPTPAKRRFTINYASLNSQAPRQSRSSTTNTNINQTTKVHSTSSPSRAKAYVLRFVDNSVDLSQFLQANKKIGNTKEQPLYPIVRAWIQNKDPGLVTDLDNSIADCCSGSTGDAEQADDERKQAPAAVHENEQRALLDTSSGQTSAVVAEKIERKQIHNADQICSFLRERKRKKDTDRRRS